MRAGRGGPFPLRAATPDDYEISANIKDELTGRTLDLREAFRVSARLRDEDTAAQMR